MSATNTTTNYSLPIFIETDKPAWLVDFNGAMRAIDAQMKVNADAIATKSPILSFNDTAEIDFTKSGDIITANLASGVSDKVGRALVTPISAPASDQLVGINTSGSQEALDIGSGLFNDNGTLKAIDLNLDDNGTSTPSGFPSGVTLSSGYVSYAFNSDRSIGKVYGTFSLRKSSSGDINTAEIDTGIVIPAPDSDYDIFPIGIVMTGGTYHFSTLGMRIKTNGHIYLTSSIWGNLTAYYYIMPCVYFFKDFGDVPTP